MSGAPRVEVKWRPPLWLIVICVLLAVLALPVGLIGWVVLQGGQPDGPAGLVGAIVLAVLLTIVVGAVLTRTLTGPIEALMARTEAIARGGREAIRPLDAYGTRELAALSQSFLDLAEALVDRSEYVRTFAAHVSHELKSPLTAIKGAVELLRDDEVRMSAEERQRFLGNVVADVDRLNALLGRLRQLAEAEAASGQGVTRLDELVPELTARFALLAVVTGAGGGITLPLPREAAAIVLGHLADNAARHGARRLTVSAAEGAGSVEMLVADDGQGISEGNRERVFEPFFTTRREQGGTGLGLGIVRSMLEAHGGSIELAPSGDGAAFRIRLRREP